MRKQGKSLLYVIRYEQERKGICYQFDSGVAHFKERSPLVVCRTVIPNLPLSEGIGKGRRFLYATQEVIDRAPDRRVVPVVRTGQPRVMRLRNCTGKRKVKRCAPSGVRSGPDAATMRRDNGTGNCQPQTCTLSLCGEEWIKNLVDMVSAQSQASVSDRDQQLTIPGPTAP
jgi:hypothetical protein